MVCRLASISPTTGTCSRNAISMTPRAWLPYRHPIVLAEELASIEQLSEGRLILGGGVGWAEAEFPALGVSFAERGRCTDEALRVMQILWTQDAPQYSGPYGSFADIIFQPKPVQQPLPLWVGGQSRP